MSSEPRFEVKELGEIDMVSRAPATLNLMTHGDARPAFPAEYLEGHTELAGGSGRVLRHDSKALLLCAGDRDLTAPLVYFAALRLGQAVAFLPALIGHELLEPPDTGAESWLQPRSASCSADQR
ncbi:MAG TPA: hypothetical protein VFB06_32640 [Streptosporangiaceae bacterium]|nr:hypothetical protein [Streptosporangiaceae bacterium]